MWYTYMAQGDTYVYTYILHTAHWVYMVHARQPFNPQHEHTHCTIHTVYIEVQPKETKNNMAVCTHCVYVRACMYSTE